MYVTITNGKKIQVVGTGSVQLKGIDGKSIRMYCTLGLDRRLLSVRKFADHGMSIECQLNSCVIWYEFMAVASGKHYGKVYVLDCHQDTAYYIEYSGIDSEWELWHARMGHLNEDSLEKPRYQRYVEDSADGENVMWRMYEGQADGHTHPSADADDDVTLSGVGSHGWDGLDEDEV
ncbi:LOW QUALITY PROTEIN: polyprotein [Phytophthora megakarya]|uniref:Polyprotein n=1 Tax=Phytophthora megakarya TaxID=4795 RepID=A0A225WF84_9STRA|nr:LOW QUALITY PROTEIN: polyprotein [Phytophthora megakarya]